MSPQPSPIRRTPVEDAVETSSLIFGTDSRSSLTIPKALISKIWGQVSEGVRILPHGGAEVGGLLVGPKSRKGRVVVDGIIPLPIEYKHGPSFRMSASDFAKIAARVQSVQGDASKAVVGFYRSQTRGQETFRDSDREIFDAIEQVHTSFAADFLCFFVLAPVSKSEMLACISTWNGDDWDAMQFALRSSLFAAVPAPSSAPPQVSVPAQAPVNRPPQTSVGASVSYTDPPLANEHGSTLPEPGTNALRLPSKVLYALMVYAPLFYAAAGLLLLAAAVGGYRWMAKNRAESAASSRTPGSVSSPRMGFSVNREGPVWKLSWDRGAMDVIKPNGAVLAIKDGDREQRLNLTASDLANGTIFYTPQGGDLLFSLQLERGGSAPIEEHIRILEGPGSSPKSAVRENPPKLPNNNAVETAVQAKARPRDSAVPTEPPRAPVSGANVSGANKEAPANPIVSPAVPASPPPAETKAAPAAVRDVQPAPAETLLPPAVAFAVPVAPRLAPPVDRELPPPRPTSPQPAANPPAVTPAVTNPGGPAPPKNAPGPGGAVPNAASPAGVTQSAAAAPAPTLPSSASAPVPVKQNYIGPKPVQQVRPQPPPNVDASGRQIQVRVQIDARGKVTSATPVGVTGVNFPLVFVSVRAAQSWQFEPAKMDGRPVASEMDLVFRF